MNRLSTLSLFLVCSLPLVLLSPAIAKDKKALTLQDIMKFRQIESPAISEDGAWVAFVEQPDRGDGEGKVVSTGSSRSYSVPRGGKAIFSCDAAWVAMVLKPRALDVELKPKEKLKSGLVILSLLTGDTAQVSNVESFAFSNNSRWLAYLLSKDEKKGGDAKPSDAVQDTTAKLKPKLKKEVGSTLALRGLDSGVEIRVSFVTTYAFDSTSRFLAYSLADTAGAVNGLYVRRLDQPGAPEDTILAGVNGAYTHLTWSNANNKLAFVAATMDEKEKPGPATLWMWDGKENTRLAGSDESPNGWIVPSKNDLAWTKDGRRLFFGLKPAGEAPEDSSAMKKDTTDAVLFDVDGIVKKRELDVWHWTDPRIIPNQKKRWKDEKDRTYRSVYHVASRKVVPLANLDLPFVDVSENPTITLGRSNASYLVESTWKGEASDVYAVELTTGSSKKIVSAQTDQAVLSPGGKWVAYYKLKQWYLYNTSTGATRCLTDGMTIAFFDEEDDRPSPPSSHGFVGWTEGDNDVLLYDKFDIWQFPTAGAGPANITGGEGRKRNLTFRIQQLNPEARFYKPGEELILSAYHNKEKYAALYTARIGGSRIEKKMEEPKRYTIIAKAKRAETLLFTRQSYAEFPDLWLSDTRLTSPRRLTDVNPQISEFAWGSAERVEWMSLDGTPLEGVLIKPGNYKPDTRYPVLVYYYERSAHRLHEFNQVVINHRPCFPFYASNGYAIFLPDIRFTIGQPGFSATKCLVPGVQKLIDMGVANPKAIGLHGHSWSGYQTAFVVTQTNIFAAAIAGAPVANMTSAYSGIRLESGLARQFQYEQEQSRIGGSLWEYPERYIENSPVFFADRINTPLLIQAGDEDEAVPWHQSVEMYLAMRRLGKECVFLQYRGEPHHLKKYANKLDYSIKMKEYLDHHLMGKPAPDWMVKGVPYTE